MKQCNNVLFVCGFILRTNCKNENLRLEMDSFCPGAPSDPVYVFRALASHVTSGPGDQNRSLQRIDRSNEEILPSSCYYELAH